MVSQICKISSTYVAVGIALAQSGEDNFRGRVFLAVMEAIPLAFIYLVAITMACDSHRPLIYIIANIGKQEISKRQEEKVTCEDMKVALPRKEEDLKIKTAAESNGIYPVLQPSD